jgi:hypothetical protein
MNNVEHGRFSSRGPIAVLVDQKLTIGSKDRVVQGGLVKPYMDVSNGAERQEQRQGITDLSGHGVAYTFFDAAFGNPLTVGVAQCYANRNASAALSARMLST